LSERENNPVTPPTDDALPPNFGDLEEGAPVVDPAALSTVFDLSVPVAIELGRTRMSVQDVLALGRGSVVELDRLVGEPIDVFVADRRFAEGEVVVVGEQFGVRITRILQQASQAVGAAS
jgi:flagellar motor switch protein FliN/FliY